MALPANWRRISDWKQTIFFVDRTQVESAFVAAHGLVLPEERLRARFPRLAALVKETGFVHVDSSLARQLAKEGATTYEVGYHRGSDGLYFAVEDPVGRTARDFDMAHLATTLLKDEDGADAYERALSDGVDAVLRIVSEGFVTERAVIVTALAPPLSVRQPEMSSDEKLAELEPLNPADLPDVTPDFIDRVAAALSEIEALPPMSQMMPALSPDKRRAYQRQAAVGGGVALAAALVGFFFAPAVAAVAIPIVILCTIIILVHELALRQSASRSLVP